MTEYKSGFTVHVFPIMPCCASGIHVDTSGSPEERQCGDGTSFPESPDLKHVGTLTANLQQWFPTGFPSLYTNFTLTFKSGGEFTVILFVLFLVLVGKHWSALQYAVSNQHLNVAMPLNVA